MFLAFGIGFLGEGTFAVGFTPLVINVLQGGAAGAGILTSAQAIGGLLASALVAPIALELSARALFAGEPIGLGLADLGLATSGMFAPPGSGAVTAAPAFMLLAGFPVVAGFAAGHGLLQTLTTDPCRGRVFGALAAVEGVATLGGLVFGATAIDAIGVAPVLGLGALMRVAGGRAGTSAAGRGERSAARAGRSHSVDSARTGAAAALDSSPGHPAEQRPPRQGRSRRRRRGWR